MLFSNILHESGLPHMAPSKNAPRVRPPFGADLHTTRSRHLGIAGSCLPKTERDGSSDILVLTSAFQIDLGCIAFDLNFCAKWPGGIRQPLEDITRLIPLRGLGQAASL
jgi:hypothetical protein